MADSPSLSVYLSFDKILDSMLCDADQLLLIDRALKLGSLLLEASKRSARKRASKHNSLEWALPPDLTIKVFSMLDTQSLCYAAAICSMFNKCAMDPLCYANIDLRTLVPEMEVAWFLSALLTGDFKFLQHLDISNREGLASEGDWYDRCFNSSIIHLKEVSEERPGLCLLAEFPSEGSFIGIDQMLDSEFSSDVSLPSQLSSHFSDGSLLLSSSESSYNSDQGSGIQEGQDSGYIIFEESSDEVDILVIQVNC